MKTSIIITTRNKLWILMQTLPKIIEQAKGDQIIVIDDESTDGTEEYLKGFDITYHRIKHEGYRVATMRNIGLDLAKHNRVIIMDDDLLIPEGYFESLKSLYKFNKLVTGSFKRQRANGILSEDWRVTNNDIRLNKVSDGVYDTIGRAVCGAVCFNKKFAGKYDEDFNQYWGGEDSFFGYKFECLGGKIIYSNKLYAIHLNHDTPKETERKQSEKRINVKVFNEKMYNLQKDSLAIMIHTFMRDEAIIRLIKSIEKHVDKYRLYISDSGQEHSEEKLEIYERLKKNGHVIINLPYDCNWTYARNTLGKKIKEKHFLYVDDDFIFTEKTNIKNMFTAMNSLAGIDIVGGEVETDGRKLKWLWKIVGIPGKIIYKGVKTDEISKTFLGVRMIFANVIPNFFLAKTSILNGENWDNNLNVGSGHSDFFINNFFHTKNKVVYTPDSTIEHKHIADARYTEKRRRKDWRSKLFDKWNSGDKIVEITDFEQSCQKVDNNVEFLITTFERYESLKRLLLSIAKYYPMASVKIADNGKIFDSNRYKELWQEIFDAGLINKPTAYNVEYDSGLSFSRNFLVNNTNSKYVLILEDDFVFTEETKIDYFIKVLDSDESVGIVGGAIRAGGNIQHFEYEIERAPEKIIYHKSEPEMQEIGGVQCKKYDSVFNFALMRREIFKQVKWDNKIKIQGEHTDFYLQVKETDWNVMYCPEVVIDHCQVFTREYKEARSRKKFLKILFKKHWVKKLIYEDTGFVYEYDPQTDTIINYNQQKNGQEN